MSFALEFQQLGGMVSGQASGKNPKGLEYSVIRVGGQYEFCGFNSAGHIVNESVRGNLSLSQATEMACNWEGK